MYSDCVEFPMEVCESVNTNHINAPLLYWNLALLHYLHIVHIDIKPENIMLSPTYRKPVFIDFGLSKIVKEKVGFKTLTSYAGTINFCSDEMAKCLWEKTDSYIDLYYNDAHCLE